RRSVFFLPACATPGLSTLSLHDALPISRLLLPGLLAPGGAARRPHRAACSFLARLPGVSIGSPFTSHRGPGRCPGSAPPRTAGPDRKSTRLNSSHDQISYAVFCLKKKTP